MPARKLTSAFCDSVNPIGGRQVAYPDHDVRGLELRVSGDGRKTWSYRYWTKTGRRGRVTLGVHSREFGLSEARASARKAQVAVDDGGDPALTRRLAKIEAATEHIKTFGDLAAAYFSDTEKGRYRPKRASLQGGAAYLARQLARFRNLPLALAAYNAGLERVARLARMPALPETWAYVAEVIDCDLALAAGRTVRSAADCRRSTP